MRDCNAFVKKVGTKFGVAIPDTNADGIVDAFSGAPFTRTTMDPSEAMAWANDGLVVAGMKKVELNNDGPHSSGHVAIIYPGEDSSHPGFRWLLGAFSDLNGGRLARFRVARTLFGMFRHSLPRT